MNAGTLIIGLADPLLGPLHNNGGPTWTHALLPGSPAIDNGNSFGCLDNNIHLLTTDQRGFCMLALEALTGMAKILANLGDETKALETILQVLAHPAISLDAKAGVERLRLELESKLDAAHIQQAQAAAHAQTYEQLVAQLPQHNEPLFA